MPYFVLFHVKESILKHFCMVLEPVASNWENTVTNTEYKYKQWILKQGSHTSMTMKFPDFSLTFYSFSRTFFWLKLTAVYR